MRGHDDDSVDSPKHHTECAFCFLPVAVRAGNKQMKTVLPRGLVAAPDDFREELTKQIRQQKPNRIRGLCAQAAAKRVRGVVELKSRLFHAPPCFLSDWNRIVEHPRDGCGRYRSFSCDIPYRDAHEIPRWCD